MGWFHRIKRFFSRYERLSLDMGWHSRRMESIQRDLREEIEALYKIATLKDYIIISVIEHAAPIFSSKIPCKRTEEERAKARVDGYQFFFKYSDGREIWVKYP